MCFSSGGGGDNVKPAGYSTEDAYKQVIKTAEPTNVEGNAPIDPNVDTKADDTGLRPAKDVAVGKGGLGTGNLM